MSGPYWLCVRGSDLPFRRCCRSQWVFYCPLLLLPRRFFAVTDDPKRTAQIYGDTVKILTKIGLLWSERGIVPDMIGHLREPGKAIAEEVGNLLRKTKISDAVLLRQAAATGGDDTPTVEAAASSLSSSAGMASAADSSAEASASDIDVSSLVSQCEAWKHLSFPLLHGKMRDRNVALVETIGAFYTSQSTLHAFFTHKDLAEERIRMMPLVDEALRRTGGTAFADRPRCVMAGCELPRAAIPGTDYCIAHHAIRFSSPVTLQDFLDNQTYRLVYETYLDEYRPHLSPLVAFLERCSRITSASNKSVLRDRARTIVRRFVAPDAEDRLFFLKQPTPAEAKAAESGTATSAATTAGASPAPCDVPSLSCGWGGGAQLPAEFLSPSMAPSSADAAGAADAAAATRCAGPSPAEPLPVLLPESRYAHIGGRASITDSERIERAASHVLLAASDSCMKVRADTFSGLTSTCLGILDRDFVESFARSPQFAAWASDNLGVPLPRISFKRLRSLVSKGVTVSAVTGAHVHLVQEGVVMAVTAIGAGAVGVDVGVPVSLLTGAALEGAEAEAAINAAAAELPADVWEGVREHSSASLPVPASAPAASEPGLAIETDGTHATAATAAAGGAPRGTRMRVSTEASFDGDSAELGSLARRGGVAGGAATPWSPGTPAIGASTGLVSPASLED